jgi:hypothetical protein
MTETAAMCRQIPVRRVAWRKPRRTPAADTGADTDGQCPDSLMSHFGSSGTHENGAEWLATVQLLPDRALVSRFALSSAVLSRIERISCVCPLQPDNFAPVRELTLRDSCPEGV